MIYLVILSISLTSLEVINTGIITPDLITEEPNIFNLIGSVWDMLTGLFTFSVTGLTFFWNLFLVYLPTLYVFFKVILN